jgi:hypothetical protein
MDINMVSDGLNKAAMGFPDRTSIGFLKRKRISPKHAVMDYADRAQVNLRFLAESAAQNKVKLALKKGEIDKEQAKTIYEAEIERATRYGARRALT